MYILKKARGVSISMYPLFSAIAIVTCRCIRKQKDIKAIAVSNGNPIPLVANIVWQAIADESRYICTNSRWKRANQPACTTSSTSIRWSSTCSYLSCTSTWKSHPSWRSKCIIAGCYCSSIRCETSHVDIECIVRTLWR